MRNPGVAAILSFFWPGLGQIYNGELGKGLGMVLLHPLLAACSVFFVVVVSAAVANANSGSQATGGGVILATIAFAVFCEFVYWIWSIYDAYGQAERLNRRRY
jgi:hypothetical protein